MNGLSNGNSVSIGLFLQRPASLLMAAIVATLLSACAPQQSKDPYDEPETQKAVISNTSLGLEYMNRGQYEVALSKLKKAVKADPDYAPAQTVLAVLYERLGEKELAGKHYKKAYEASPRDGDVNNNYGVYLCQNGKQDQAIKHFLAALNDPFYSSPSIALTNAGFTRCSGEYVEADFRTKELPEGACIYAKIRGCIRPHSRDASARLQDRVGVE
jgi:type IV pilus assembly protein PilF